MKKKINLLLRQKKYQQIAAKIEYTKNILFIGIFIIFLLVIISFLGYMYMRKKFESLLLQKKALLTFIVDNRKEEAGYIYFSNKEMQISNIIRNDLNYGPYYEFLRGIVTTSTDEGRLESLAMDKDRKVNFVLTLPDYSSVLSFLSSIESNAFLSHFKSLSLTHFSTFESPYQSYKLEFKGQFVEQ